MRDDTEQNDPGDCREFRHNSRFIALDVETANSDRSSICQIAAVSFVGTTVVDVWQSLVDPEDFFEPFNVCLHGIDKAAVEHAPRFPAVFGQLSSLLTDAVVASHTAFDRIALERVCQKYRVPHLDCTWLDTARVSRRAWPRFARTGYGLKSIAACCGIEFRHHDAAEDAKAAGSVLAQAITETGIDLRGWLTQMAPRVRKRRSLPNRRKTIARRIAGRHERSTPAAEMVL